MLRHRRIAAGPKRTVGETWEAIADVVRSSLTVSDDIATAEVDAALDVASGIGRLLIGGGHLNNEPLTVVAADLHVNFTTVSADEALTLDENLNIVPGAATASEWTLYLPDPDPLTSAVKAAASGDDHLEAGGAPQPAPKVAAGSGNGLDRGALSEWARGGG